MITCPNCHQPVEDGNDFCPFCGVKLPASGAAPESEASEPARVVRKICPNRHIFTDAELQYCPECGLELRPLDEPEVWVCPHCGRENTDGDICIFCGKNRYAPVTPEIVPEPPRYEKPAPIPGLRPATLADLARK